MNLRVISKIHWIFVFILAFTFLHDRQTIAEDIEGSSDHPMTPLSLKQHLQVFQME